LRSLQHSLQLLHELTEVITVDSSIVRIPASCPMCGQEYLIGLGLDTISDRLATDRSIKLYCNCPHHSVTWVANEIERDQIREYTEAVQFFVAEAGRRHRRSARRQLRPI
jgi:hypothetical protein